MTWTAARIQLALAHHFDWFRNKLMPEWEIDGGVADLLVVSKARYLTEVEIKISPSDWNSDRLKEKWKQPRPHISRFYYAVPDSLEDSVPTWVPATAGLILISPRYSESNLLAPLGSDSRDRAMVIRKATRLKAQALTDAEYQQMLNACYFRYWRARLKTTAEGKPLN